MSNRIFELAKGVFHGDHAAQQLIRHLIVGGSGVVFNWVAFSLLRHFTRLDTLQSTLVVHAVLLATIFPLQKMFTFKKKTHGNRQAIRFLVNDVGYITLDYLLALGFIDMLGFPAWFGKGCGLAILTPLSFLSQRLWVFADAPPPKRPGA
ncbi:MAG: GtrA family protein [Pseudomonadota bacterium]